MKILKNSFLFSVYYFLSWTIYFVFARLFFLIFQLDKTLEIDFLTILKTFVYGIKLDFSFTAYISIIPFLMVAFSAVTPIKYIKKIIQFYTFFLLVVLNLLLLIDAGLYKPWGFRLDTSILAYIDTPELMIASVSKKMLFLGTFFFLLITYVSCKIFSKIIQKKIALISPKNKLQIPIFLLLTALLIFPLRGGLQTIPINQSNVYFSKNMFANHAAINYSWNFFNTLTHKTSSKNIYKTIEDKIANNSISNRNKLLKTSAIDSILKTDKPNVILIIWEGLTAKVVGVLDGEPTVTPNFNSYAKQGILFTNYFANGDRTDKGIPAILSGYYPLPIKRVMRMPNKTRKLPMLPQKMISEGYETSFYYGGDLNFGNMNTYLRNAGITNFVDGNSFSKKDWNDKWGVHDHVLINRFIKDFKEDNKKPFFKIALTLSSHEPFQFPDTYQFGRDTEDNLFRSSHFYTDKAIGKFLDFAVKQPWYKNTLIVIMADHGHGSPKHDGLFNGPKKFKIPMLWLGGALHKTGLEIDSYSSQVDFSYTLLDLLKINNSQFTFGNHLFNNSPKKYAYFNFNKGFGVVDKNNEFIFDFVSNKTILKKGPETALLDTLGRAISQRIYKDFLNR